MEIDVEVKGLLETQRNLEKQVASLHGEPVLNAVREATLLVDRDAKLEAPSDMGIGRASITPEVRVDGNTTMGVIGSNKEYMAYQELGTRAYWPPPGSMEVWARRHPPWTDFTIRRHISKHGVKAKHFLRNAFNKNKDRIMCTIERAVKEITQK